jgi:hypothetical protein
MECRLLTAIVKQAGGEVTGLTQLLKESTDRLESAVAVAKNQPGATQV